MDTLRKVYYSLPVGLRYVVRKIYFGFKPEPTQYYNGIRLPKSGEIFTGRGDFLRSGKKTVDHLIKHADLQHNSKVLDIGCGLGRVAVPMTDILTKGEYYGFDIVSGGIKYAQKNISKRFPQFHFLHHSLSNDLYTSGGGDASNYRFPYDSSFFDLAVANSLFTHLTIREVERYVHESSRVLKDGGLLYATFFVKTAKRAEVVAQNPNGFSFPYNCGKYSLMSEKVQSANVAYDEDFLESLFKEASFEIDSKFYGSWAQESGESIDFQDVYILRKIKK